MDNRFQKMGLVLGAGVLTLMLYWSGLFVLWTPLPLLYLSLRRDPTCWVLAFGTTLVLTAMIHGVLFPFMGVHDLAYYLGVSFLLGIGFWKKMPLFRFGAFVGIVATIGVFVVGFTEHRLGLFNFHPLFETFLREAYFVLDQMSTQASFKENRLEILAFVAQTKEAFQSLPKILPSLIFTFTVFVMMLNLGCVKMFARVSGSFKGFGEFTRLQIPFFCVWLAIAGGLLFFLDFYALKVSWLKWVALNLFILVFFAYFIQGLSIMTFFLKRYSLLFRFGIYGLVILFFQMMGFIVVGLGLADTWFDFRKLHQQKA